MSRVRHLPPHGRALAALCWLCLTVTPAVATEFTVGEHEFSFGGFVNTGNALRLSGEDERFIGIEVSDVPRMLLNQNLLQLQLSGSHPGEVYSQLNIDLTATGAPDRPFDDAAEFEIDEAYIDFRAGNIDWRIGKEKVIWGKSDIISPYDILTARDVKDPFVNETLLDRVGQWGVKATYSWSDYSWQTVFNPVWTRSDVPEAATGIADDGTILPTDVDAWFPPVGTLPTVALETGDFNLPWFIFLATYNQVEYPEQNLETATFGTKLNMLKGSWDTDFYFVSAIDPLPHPEITALFVQTTFQGQPALQLEIDGRLFHNRLNTLGAATSTTWGRLAFRSEVAFTQGAYWYRLFDEEQISDLLLEFDLFGIGALRNPGEEHSSFKAIVGGDIELPGTGVFLTNQLSINHGFSHRPEYFQAATEVNMTNLVRRSFMDDYLTLSWVDLINFSSGSIWLRPTVSYTFPAYEDFSVSAGLNVFAGDEFSLVGQYTDFNSLTFSARLYF